MRIAAALLILLAVPAMASTSEFEAATEPLPGIKFAEALAQTTGIAIAPLTSVSAIGAWKYVRAGGESRAALPWFASPWFWAPGLLICFLLFAKDILPAPLRKPVTSLELFENKLSALLLGAPTLIPLLSETLASSEPHTQHAAGLIAAGMGTELFANAGAYISGIIIFVPIFLVIWVLFQALNVLILLSPFRILDLLLRMTKTSILAVLAMATLIHPFFGLAIVIVILGVAFLIAGWAWRLTVFGTVLAFDLLTLRQLRCSGDSGQIVVFCSDAIGKVNHRTRGWLKRTPDGGLLFTYRPWLVLGTRSVGLSSGDYSVQKGILCPSIVGNDSKGKRKQLFLLPPRYRSHEAAIAASMKFAGPLDMTVIRGLKALREWLLETVGGKSKPKAGESPA